MRINFDLKKTCVNKKKVNDHFSSNFYLGNVLCVGVIWVCLLGASIAQPSRAAAL
jgi:hypothetical protein